MEIKLGKIDYTPLDRSVIFLYGSEVAARALPLKRDEVAFLEQKRNEDISSLVVFNRLPHRIYVQNFDSELPNNETLEKLRCAAANLQTVLSKEKVDKVAVSGEGVIPEEVVAFVEGLHLSNYRFDKYKNKKECRLNEVVLEQHIIEQDSLDENLRLWRRIDTMRDWVNEPVMQLNAPRFADLLKAEAERTANVKCTVMGQKKIESLKMGGLLAVNRGSEDEARFVVLEYKPADRINCKAVALVGKGVMYDTGGLNIKPGDYMTEMKSDMAGAALMASAVLAAAENALPVWVRAYLPLTDNRPCKNAYAADDILTMYDGTTVEITNTDAEGRLILADAIAYAAQEDPELIIDAATLTGAAVRALGTKVAAVMQDNAEGPLNLLQIVGKQVYERLAELPFWKDYDELLKSEVADMINCNLHANAGTITAGRFLAHFAKGLPYIHLDIAGVAFYSKRESFYGTGASGFGLRLLYAFLQMYDICKSK
ncbi:MAG: leucyl aminopeptidase family protein [Bacteroidales bacterium]|nr:leucyl aminopeptidase family protein [Bacteroidales bacterium]